ncbi:MAG TPA: WYL domain-containing protein, partial [Gammaproteobacteria bacterium]
TAAAQERRRVHMNYRSATGDATAREFDAYGLVYRYGRWYASGLCHLRKGLRSFRVDRVQDVRTLDATFERPDGFDAAKHLTFSIATLPRAFVVDVLLHTDLKTAAEELRESLGLLEAREGGVLLRAHTDSIDWYARQLARLPFDFDILAPVELQRALHAHARRLLRGHGEGE